MEQPMKRLLAILLVLSLAVPFGGCGGGGKKPTAKPSGSAATTSAPGSAAEVTVGLWGLGQAVEGKASGSVREYIARNFGLEIVPWPVTKDDWKEKIASAAASGALPDMFAQGIYEDRMLFRQLVDQKLIRELPESVYKNFHWLGTVMYRYRKTESVDGKMYFVPRTDMAEEYNNGQSVAIWYRLDWAMESGLINAGEALSWQDFVALMQFFTHNDPDKNGVDDTRALTSAGPGLGGLRTAFYMTFGVRDWVLEGGRWIPGLLSGRAKEATKWANQASRSGLVDPQYATQSQDEALEAFCLGQAGMLVADASPAGAARLNATLQVKQPALDIRQAVSVLPQPVNPWGVAYNEDVSYSTGTAFSAAVDDKKLKQIFGLMDWLYSDEGLTYMNWGVKGTDYNVTGDGLQTLHRTEADNLPVTFGQLDAEFGPLAELSTWGRDFIPGARDDDYRLKYLAILKDHWWTNNWRRPMFTRYIADASVQGFDADLAMETALAGIIARSSDVEKDWAAYVSQMTGQLNVDAVAKIVNDYAQQNKITTEE
jgi:putative aldouronate transport system substrate-binding protein